MATGNGDILIPLVGVVATGVNETGHGDIQITVSSVSSDGITQTLMSGAVTHLPPAVAGTLLDGKVTITADLPALAPTVSGAGQVEAITALAPTIAATGVVGQVGVAEILLAADVAGTNLTGFAGVGDIIPPQLDVSGGSAPFGDLQTPFVVVEGSLHTGQLGVASLFPSTPTVAATGSSAGVFATGAVQPLIPTLSATGISLSRIDGDLPAAIASIEATGVTGQIGTVSITVPVIDLEAALLSDSSGTADVIVSLPIITATGVTQILSPVFTGVAVNTRNAASTEYTGLNINSMTQYSGMILAATDTGLVALTGITDDGTDISANVSGGITDFKSTGIKKVIAGYVTCRADGPLSMSLITDEKTERSYTLAPRETGLHPAKVRFGLGVQGRHWQWKMANNGNDFNINEITIDVETSTRRRY